MEEFLIIVRFRVDWRRLAKVRRETSMLDGVQRSGTLPILLPEASTVAEIEVGYLPLKVLPLSKEERRRYWNKTVVEFDGEVTLAELVIRGLAERQGFDAVWVTGADRFTKTWPRKPVELPPVSRHWYARVAPVVRELNRRVFGKDSKGGCWDIIGCRGDEIVFVESKRMGKDEINDYQRGWLEAAVREGVPLSSFNIIEWE